MKRTKALSAMSFATYDVERRTRKGTFYMQVKSKDRIWYKAQRNNPLSKWESVFNKLISKKCWVVERTFGSQKQWFGVSQTRLKGLDKVHTQHILEAIAYNLKRSPKMEILPAF